MEESIPSPDKQKENEIVFVYEEPSRSGTTAVVGGQIMNRVNGVWMSQEELRTHQRSKMTPDEARLDEIEERLGVCTCGDAQTNFWEPIVAALRLVKNREFYDDKMAYALLYFLAAADLVDHGISMAHCTLTTDGEWLMENYEGLSHKL